MKTESNYYYLNDDHSVKPCSLIEWSQQQNQMFKDNSKHLALNNVGHYSISTVWLGINHNFHFKGRALLFETMVFDKDDSIYTDRYSTWDEAIEGHKKAVQWVQWIEDNCKK